MVTYHPVICKEQVTQNALKLGGATSQSGAFSDILAILAKFLAPTPASYQIGGL